MLLGGRRVVALREGDSDYQGTGEGGLLGTQKILFSEFRMIKSGFWV